MTSFHWISNQIVVTFVHSNWVYHQEIQEIDIKSKRSKLVLIFTNCIMHDLFSQNIHKSGFAINITYIPECHFNYSFLFHCADFLQYVVYFRVYLVITIWVISHLLFCLYFRHTAPAYMTSSWLNEMSYNTLYIRFMTIFFLWQPPYTLDCLLNKLQECTFIFHKSVSFLYQ